MTQPSPNDINDALDSITKASEFDQRIAQFQLDREKGERPLGIATATTGSGAPLLNRDATVRGSYPNYALESVKRSWWSRLSWWR